jgi:hypothetical protein
MHIMLKSFSDSRSALVAACLASLCSAASAQGLETVIDNGATGFQSSYAWTASTIGPFVGANHLTAPGLSAIIDNTSAGFSTQGSWGTSTAQSGFYGSNYALAPYPAVRKYRYPALVIDNTTYDMSNYGCNITGATTEASGYYGRDYIKLSRSNPYLSTKCTFTYTPKLAGNAGGTYPVNIYAHWPANAAHASNARITISDTSGKTRAAFTVNQKASSGEWTLLGTYLETGGTTYVIFDASNADGIVAADAIKVESAEFASENVAKWTLPAGLSGDYDLYARWPNWTGGEAFPAWTVVGGDGSHFIYNTSQRENTGQWRYLGRINTTGSQKNYVQLEHFGETGALVADAVAYVPTGRFPTATWKHATLTGSFNLYANWSPDATRSTKASYIVRTMKRSAIPYYLCDVSTKIIDVDQSAPYQGRRLLGTFTAGPDASCAGVTVTLQPNDKPGTLSADAITVQALP